MTDSVEHNSMAEVEGETLTDSAGVATPATDEEASLAEMGAEQAYFQSFGAHLEY